MQELIISFTSVDENTGIARIYFDGVIAVPKDCDDPIIELFRPIRLKYHEKMLFSTTTVKKPDSIVIAINPSNGRNRPLNEFLKTAKEALEGFGDYPGIIREYTEILEKYISSERGLKTYVKLAKEVETASNSAKAEKIKACNDSIKKFVAGEGLKMPSFKKPTVRKEPKAKKNTKKPAN